MHALLERARGVGAERGHNVLALAAYALDTAFAVRPPDLDPNSPFGPDMPNWRFGRVVRAAASVWGRAPGEARDVVERVLAYRPPLPTWRFRIEDVPVWCGICLLRRRDVEGLVSIKHTQIYRLISRRRFPAPLSLGPRTVRWVKHEVQDWLRERCSPPGPPGPGLSVPVAPMSARAA